MLEAERLHPEPLEAGTAAPVAAPSPVHTLVTSRRKIRAPFHMVWREFRFRFLPIVAFVAACLFAFICWRQWVTLEPVNPSGSGFAKQPQALDLKGVEAVADKHGSSTLPRLDSARN